MKLNFFLNLETQRSKKLNKPRNKKTMPRYINYLKSMVKENLKWSQRKTYLTYRRKKPI